MHPTDSEENISALLASYHPSSLAKEVIMQAPPVLLVGISGAGKDTIKKALLKTGRYFDFISYTTRQPRVNHGVPEKDGVDYHFIDLPEAKRMLYAGEFIEAKEYSG